MRPKGETPLNLELMRLIDAQFLETPWYGSRQMARHLRREGYTVRSQAHPAADGADGFGADLSATAIQGAASEHRISPYLLRDTVSER
jgi:putative transposase